MRAAALVVMALLCPSHFAGAHDPNRTAGVLLSERGLADQHIEWQLAYKTSSAVATGTFQGWDADTIRGVL